MAKKRRKPGDIYWHPNQWSSVELDGGPGIRSDIMERVWVGKGPREGEPEVCEICGRKIRWAIPRCWECDDLERQMHPQSE